MLKSIMYNFYSGINGGNYRSLYIPSTRFTLPCIAAYAMFTVLQLSIKHGFFQTSISQLKISLTRLSLRVHPMMVSLTIFLRIISLMSSLCWQKHLAENVVHTKGLLSALLYGFVPYKVYCTYLFNCTVHHNNGLQSVAIYYRTFIWRVV